MMNGNDFRLYQGMDFSEFLAHYGVGHDKGGHSGRYAWGSGKNPKQRSGKRVFVSGSSKTQDKESGYYRRKLPKAVRQELDAKMKNGDTILVGDAPGIDRQVQDYLKKKRYKNVEVYGPGSEDVRYQADKRWKKNLVDDPDHEKGSSEWLAKKDIAMSEAADEGIAVILDEGGAKATRNNVARLMNSAKRVSVYEISQTGAQFDQWLDDNGKDTILDVYRKAESDKKLMSMDRKELAALIKDKEISPNANRGVSKAVREAQDYLSNGFKDEIESSIVSKFTKDEKKQYRELYKKLLKEYTANDAYMPKMNAAYMAALHTNDKDWGDIELAWDAWTAGDNYELVKAAVKDLGFEPTAYAIDYVTDIVNEEWRKANGRSN